MDGGVTKLFINMEEDGTFRYVQNFADLPLDRK